MKKIFALLLVIALFVSCSTSTEPIDDEELIITEKSVVSLVDEFTLRGNLHIVSPVYYDSTARTINLICEGNSSLIQGVFLSTKKTQVGYDIVADLTTTATVRPWAGSDRLIEISAMIGYEPLEVMVWPKY